MVGMAYAVEVIVAGRSVVWVTGGVVSSRYPFLGRSSRSPHLGTLASGMQVTQIIGPVVDVR